jgi:outer membrane protein OmpA-like peptidoglycan-associated protein
MRRYDNMPSIGVVLAAGGLALAACASQPPQNAALNQARSSFSSASGNPAVARYGAYPLAEAQENLVTAQQAWANNEPASKVTHYANLAQTQSDIAVAVAKRRTAQSENMNVAREITLGDMLFQTGKARLNAEGMAAVGQLAVFMKNNPDRNIAVIGYTDSTGSRKLNARLSDERAAAVKTALLAQGIVPNRVTTAGRGPADPVASNDTASGRQQNRRVMVDISTSTTAGAGTSSPSR